MSKKPKFPLIKDLVAIIKGVKSYIEDDYIDEGDTLPSITLTVGNDPLTGGWSYQTGDNSYSGGAYSYHDWGVVTIYRRSNSKELARDIIAQLDELTWYRDEFREQLPPPPAMVQL